MTNKDSIGKQLSNPFSTGGGGVQFEAHVQASFVILMLADGFVPCLPTLPIKKIKFQGKIDGYETDDLILFMEEPDGNQKQKLLAQIKHSINFTASDGTFTNVVQSAWRDFNNGALFSKRQDAIAIITGPLSATDIDGARWILEWARSCETAEEFVRYVGTANFSSENKREKLAAFRVQLTKANGGNEVADDQLFDFLKHFHILGYDLDVKSGVVLSLLHSIINQFSVENVRAIWTQVIDEVSTANKNAGTLSKANLPLELVTAFQRQVYATIPETYAPSEVERPDPNQFSNASAIALANLLGAWNENNEHDCGVVSKLADEKYSEWIKKLQESLQIADSPLRLRDGEWHVIHRSTIWESLGARIFDQSLDAFKHCVTLILRERDPKFDLPSGERFGASVRGKTLSYSRALRRGLAETLALMGANPKALSNSSDGKVRTVAILSLREIFQAADWITWGSLNDLLPLLAEAAPAEFLAIVERDVRQTPCPFEELFRQESTVITGENYMIGLLWALESLAWDEEHFVQSCVLLSELAAHDPGGHSGNRPFNSLVTILLPWLPQTEASTEKRMVAVQTITKEQPDIAWRLLLNLLPKPQQMSMRSHRPTFRNIAPTAIDRDVTTEEYWQQISIFTDMALDLANSDVEKLVEFAAVLDRLPSDKIIAFASRLTAAQLGAKPLDETINLWRKLTEFLSRQRRIAKQHSVELPKFIMDLEAVAKSIEPENPAYQYQKLFGHNDREFYRDSGTTWEEKEVKRQERRGVAIKKILEYGGVASIFEFIELADAPIFVGHTLGTVADDDMDSPFLPAKLTSENRRILQFLMGYVRARFHKHGWEWVQRMSLEIWSREELGRFLALLPFTSDTWKKVTELLGDSDPEYWLNVNPNPFEASNNLGFAIDKLIENDRPTLALACLNRAKHDNQPMNLQQAERALLSLANSPELGEAFDRYDVVEVIKALQEAPEADLDAVGKIEWQFLQLLDRDLGVAPKALERQLASKPEFFCEVIRLLYRSKHDPQDSKLELTPQQQLMAEHAWMLLHEWQLPPGVNTDGSFSSTQFNEWLETIQEICSESGHLSVALTHVGCVLYYSPPDPDGLWIHRAIAEALNQKNAEKLRTGFRQQIFNSRGIHWVDPTGQPERDLSDQYRGKAESVENAGFQRLAASLREIADAYAWQAEQVIKEAEAEKLENEDW